MYLCIALPTLVQALEDEKSGIHVMFIVSTFIHLIIHKSIGISWYAYYHRNQKLVFVIISFLYFLHFELKIEMYVAFLKRIRTNKSPVCWLGNNKLSVVGCLLWTQIASSWGQHGAHLGPVGPRWAPGWPQEPCYQGIFRENRYNRTALYVWSLCVTVISWHLVSMSSCMIWFMEINI